MNQSNFKHINSLRNFRTRLKNILNFWPSTGVKWSKPTGIRTNFLIHHTVTKKKEQFVRKSRDHITWYICGPTVYDSAHLGHASCYMRFDIIRRILQNYLKTPIIQAMCVTNIDDKIIQRSQESGIDWKVLTKVYEKEFFDDLASLNIEKPSIIARATDFIPQMVRFIEQLVEKELAYLTADGSVYFDLQKYGNSGKFRAMMDLNYPYHQQPSPYKKCATDFVLWKAVKPSEPFWPSPWGHGRPGWHIECSAIASEYFGDSIDLHSGASDLIFPHHENEESQCCAYHGTSQWVNYWMHSGQLYLTKDNEKMSKSLKNTISIRDFLRSYSHHHFRMLCFMMNYRTHIVFTDELMETSVRCCKKFINFFDDTIAYINGYSNKGDIDSPKLLQILEETKQKVTAAVHNDFDTELCLQHLQHLINETNVMLSSDLGRRCPVSVAQVYYYIRDTLNSFGFDFTDVVASVDSKSTVKIERLIDSSVTFRDDVREIALATKKSQMDLQNGCSKLFKLCDNFRQELRCEGIVVKDHKDNKSTWTYSDTKKEEE